MIVATSDTIADKKIVQTLGLVRGIGGEAALPRSAPPALAEIKSALSYETLFSLSTKVSGAFEEADLADDASEKHQSVPAGR